MIVAVYLKRNILNRYLDRPDENFCYGKFSELSEL